MHFLFLNEFAKARKEWAQIGSLERWQIVGAFDNLMGSGFDKNYEPIKHPENTAQFISSNNAQISWFTPIIFNDDAWITVGNYVQEYTGIIYAQTFINSPSEQEVILGAGVNGNLKVWVNDRLVLAESEERITELDAFKTRIKLQKGYNRILVQIGFVDNRYPNFIIRLMDDNYQIIKGLTHSEQVQPYIQDKGSFDATKMIQHFAEAHFEKAIKDDPKNPVNYILLCKTFLRNRKLQEARETIEQAIGLFGENDLFRLTLLDVLIKSENRTETAEMVDKMIEVSPNSYLSSLFLLERLKREEKYEEASEMLLDIRQKFGEDENTLKEQIELALALRKSETILRLADEAYKQYPDYKPFVQIRYNIIKKLEKDAKAAIKLLETYLDKKYDYEMMQVLINEYFEQGMVEKGLNLAQKPIEAVPYEAPLYIDVARYYIGLKNYNKAIEYTQKALGISPYEAEYYEVMGLIYEQQGKEKEAIQYFTKALSYNANSYKVRQKLRLLENKEDLLKYLPNPDIYTKIKESKNNNYEGFYDWYYVLDQKSKIVYPEGTSEEYFQYAIKILSDKGIDNWKEYSISYNDYRQRLIIEKAEVVKKNGSKIQAEISDNNLVFPKLEKGDAIHFKYKLETYSYGRFAKSFWDKYWLNAFVPSETARYSLLIANSVKFDYQFINSDLKPNIQNMGDFTLYSWEINNEKAMKEENYMPAVSDVGKVLHLSSVNSWQEIATWYNDISALQAKNDFEVKQVYQKLFPDNTPLSQTQKARIIYEYIVKNIKYSSVPFRQSAYVPQTAAKTIQTKLGDCKDVSTLYAALAREAGIPTNLVLIDTRENGNRDMVLPSLEFNHCIVKSFLDGKPQYLELTDANLPFGSLPPNLVGSLSLEIPFDNPNSNVNLETLKPSNKSKNNIKRLTQLDVVNGKDLKIKVNSTRKGYFTSSTREKYSSLSNELQTEEIQKSLSNGFKNPVVVLETNFGNLESLTDSIQYQYTYMVRNEIIEIGELKTFKIPFSDVLFTTNSFTEENRQFPIDYWKYDYSDEHFEEITINIADNQQFTDFPKDLKIEFKGSTYELIFKKLAPNKLLILRNVKFDKNNISNADYGKFKEFVNTITNLEAKYLAFK